MFIYVLFINYVCIKLLPTAADLFSSVPDFSECLFLYSSQGCQLLNSHPSARPCRVALYPYVDELSL